MNNLARDVAEDVFGAAKDGGMKVLIVKMLIFLIANLQAVGPTPKTRVPPRLLPGDT